MEIFFLKSRTCNYPKLDWLSKESLPSTMDYQQNHSAENKKTPRTRKLSVHLLLQDAHAVGVRGTAARILDRFFAVRDSASYADEIVRVVDIEKLS